MTDACPLPLAGLTVLVTGSIDNLSRDQAREAITTLGGTPAPGVSRKVDLVVLGEGAGLSKSAKARAFQIPVLPGDAFGALAANPERWDQAPVGMTFAAYDAQSVVPDEPTYPIVDRDHWVAKGAGHVIGPDGTSRRQVRLMCACGHHWMRDTLWGPDACPQPVRPITTPPWHDTEYLASTASACRASTAALTALLGR